MKNKNGIILLVVIVAIIFAGVIIALSYFNGVKGSVFVDSFPRGAEVFLDGVKQGETPITIKDLSLGEYEIQVSHDGYRTFTKTFSITRANPKVTVIANLEHVTFVLQVSSYPTEAEVYVDGEKKGLTPITIDDLPLGEHFVEVTKENFNTWSQKIDVSEYKVIQLMANLQATSASISVDSDPEGATVYINDKQKGVTPLKVGNLDAGDYTLRVEKEGFAPYTEKITVSKGETVTRNIALKKAETVLSIDSDPEGAELFLNGEDVGKTPFKKLNIKPGAYNIKIVKEGYLPFVTKITVKKGVPANYKFPLLKLPSDKSGSNP